jgi:hypothetical protein
MTIHVSINLILWLGVAAYALLGLLAGIPILSFMFSDWDIPKIWGAHLAAFLIGWTLWLPLIIIRIIITLLNPESWR